MSRLSNMNWAVVVPMANEEPDFAPFVGALRTQLDALGSGRAYFVVDNVSKDRTLELCRELSTRDSRFTTIWAPENRCVVDAYLRGYKEALQNGHAYILEMDAGLSHDPATLPVFLEKLADGYECVFGSRFIEGGSMGDSPPKRVLLSRTGTVLSNILLGTRLHDMTSGYQGFHRRIVERFCAQPLLSRGHFYQTELRYLLRRYKSVEVPIRYKAPSPRVSSGSIRNSLETLLHFWWRRLTFRAQSL
jgi:dolichol-phosphate mannosyltransferase